MFRNNSVVLAKAVFYTQENIYYSSALFHNLILSNSIILLEKCECLRVGRYNFSIVCSAHRLYKYTLDAKSIAVIVFQLNF